MWLCLVVLGESVEVAAHVGKWFATRWHKTAWEGPFLDSQATRSEYSSPSCVRMRYPPSLDGYTRATLLDRLDIPLGLNDGRNAHKICPATQQTRCPATLPNTAAFEDGSASQLSDCNCLSSVTPNLCESNASVLDDLILSLHLSGQRDTHLSNTPAATMTSAPTANHIAYGEDCPAKAQDISEMCRSKNCRAKRHRAFTHRSFDRRTMTPHLPSATLANSSRFTHFLMFFHHCFLHPSLQKGTKDRLRSLSAQHGPALSGSESSPSFSLRQPPPTCLLAFSSLHQKKQRFCSTASCPPSCPKRECKARRLLLIQNHSFPPFLQSSLWARRTQHFHLPRKSRRPPPLKPHAHPVPSHIFCQFSTNNFNNRVRPPRSTPCPSSHPTRT